MTTLQVLSQADTGRFLREGGFITSEQLTQAWEASRANGTGLLDTLVSSGTLMQETLKTVHCFLCSRPVVNLMQTQVDPEAVRLVPEAYARKRRVLPVRFDRHGSLIIATQRPFNDLEFDVELSAMMGFPVPFKVVMAMAMEGDSEEELLDGFIDKAYPHS